MISKVDTHEGTDIFFDTEHLEFSAKVDDERFTDETLPALKKQITRHKRQEFKRFEAFVPCRWHYGFDNGLRGKFEKVTVTSVSPVGYARVVKEGKKGSSEESSVVAITPATEKLVEAINSTVDEIRALEDKKTALVNELGGHAIGRDTLREQAGLLDNNA